jgi:hypothetical protein
LLDPTKAERGPSTRRTCTAACVDEASCRMFLCVRCRSQVLVCRVCDRGQIYCAGTCAQEARRDRQREARRRYQATPRGRAMHAERSRRYRARWQRVTDHGPAKAGGEALSPGFDVDATLSPPSLSGRPAGHQICHHCGRRPALPFLRLSALRPRRRRSLLHSHARRSRRPP